jgi:hypothetical protein
MRRVVTFAVLVPMTVLMIVACGDDEETLTTDEFVEQADAICAAGTTELDDAFAELYGPSGEEPTPEQQTAFVEDTVAPLIQGQIDSGEALNPPEDLQDEVEQWLADVQTVLDGITDDPESIFGPEAEDLFAEVDAQASEIGLTACAGED